MTESPTEAIRIGIEQCVIEWHANIADVVETSEAGDLENYFFYDARGKQLNGKHQLPSTPPKPFRKAVRQVAQYGFATATTHPSKLDDALKDTSKTREQF